MERGEGKREREESEEKVENGERGGRGKGNPEGRVRERREEDNPYS